MGKYLNLGNESFRRIRQGRYIDKTGLIAEMNRRTGTTDNLVCVSRPRRFGRSFAVQEICAYYDCSCDSHELFKDFAIAGSEKNEEHINQYNVVCLDIARTISSLGSTTTRRTTRIPALLKE